MTNNNDLHQSFRRNLKVYKKFYNSPAQKGLMGKMKIIGKAYPPGYKSLPKRASPGVIPKQLFTNSFYKAVESIAQISNSRYQIGSEIAYKAGFLLKLAESSFTISESTLINLVHQVFCQAEYVASVSMAGFIEQATFSITDQLKYTSAVAAATMESLSKVFASTLESLSEFHTKEPFAFDDLLSPESFLKNNEKLEEDLKTPEKEKSTDSFLKQIAVGVVSGLIVHFIAKLFDFLLGLLDSGVINQPQAENVLIEINNNIESYSSEEIIDELLEYQFHFEENL